MFGGWWVRVCWGGLIVGGQYGGGHEAALVLIVGVGFVRLMRRKRHCVSTVRSSSRKEAWDEGNQSTVVDRGWAGVADERRSRTEWREADDERGGDVRGEKSKWRLRIGE